MILGEIICIQKIYINMTLSIGELAQNFHELMVNKNAKGFTIGKGKKIYWYIVTYARTGQYKCLRFDENNILGYPRFVNSNTNITIIY